MNESGNMSYSEREMEVDIIDILWDIVYSWRMIAACGIIFAVLLAGGKYITDSKNPPVNEDTMIENIRNYLTYEEALFLERAIIENDSIERQLKFNTEYQKNSILMNIDPYNETRIALQYYIDTDYKINLNESVFQDYAQGLMRAYITYLGDAEITERFAQKLNLKSGKYLAELINTDRSFNLDRDMFLMPDHSFCIYVTGKEMEHARSVANTVKEALDKYQNVLSEKIGTHSLVLVSENEQMVQNNALAEKQEKLEASNHSLRTQQENLMDKLNTYQLKILEYERYNRDHSVEKEDADVSKTKPGINKKYLVMGFIAGVLLICIIITLSHIFARCLKNEKEIQRCYGLRILGILDHTPSSKKIFSFVDGWLDRLSGKQKRILEEELERTITNLILICKKYELDKVFFTTSVQLSESEKNLLNQILSQITKESVEVVFEANMMWNKNALIQMSDIGNVVLVEKAKKTKYQDLEDELLLCREQKANVLGVLAIK